MFVGTRIKSLSLLVCLAALLGMARSAQAAPELWNWAEQHYGIQESGTESDKHPGKGLLLPYWDAWLLRPPGAEATVEPINRPLPAPSPLPVLSPKAWIYISKLQQKLFLKDGDQTLMSWPVSTARYSLSTPVGRFRIIENVIAPTYNGRHGSFRSGDPRNPLGTRWLGLNVGHFRTGVPIGIHGTNEPDKIGTAVSDGCIRLRNSDVELLSRLIKTGMPVVISNQ